MRSRLVSACATNSGRNALKNCGRCTGSRAAERRAIDSTSSTIRSMRSEFASMIVVMRRSGPSGTARRAGCRHGGSRRADCGSRGRSTPTGGPSRPASAAARAPRGARGPRAARPCPPRLPPVPASASNDGSSAARFAAGAAGQDRPRRPPPRRHAVGTRARILVLRSPGRRSADQFPAARRRSAPAAPPGPARRPRPPASPRRRPRIARAFGFIPLMPPVRLNTSTPWSSSAITSSLIASWLRRSRPRREARRSWSASGVPAG